MDCTNINTAAVEMKIKDITKDKLNKKILHRLKNNDPNFIRLRVYIGDNNEHRFGGYYPKTAVEWAVLGYFVGKSTCLSEICICGGYEPGVRELPKCTSTLFSGLAHQSIKLFELSYIELSGR